MREPFLSTDKAQAVLDKYRERLEELISELPEICNAGRFSTNAVAFIATAHGRLGLFLGAATLLNSLAVQETDTAADERIFSPSEMEDIDRLSLTLLSGVRRLKHLNEEKNDG